MQHAVMLAGHTIPFIHILREGRLANGIMYYQTSFTTPLENEADKITKSWRYVNQKTKASLAASLQQDSFIAEYLEYLKNSMQSQEREVRMGRMDYVLRSCYLSEEDLGQIPAALRNYVGKANQIIQRYHYKTLIMDGIKQGLL